jgi:hypothetical protein
MKPDTSRRTRITVRMVRTSRPSPGIPRKLHRALGSPRGVRRFFEAGLRAIGIAPGRLTHAWLGLELLDLPRDPQLPPLRKRKRGRP